jgi:hypothetical protein
MLEKKKVQRIGRICQQIQDAGYNKSVSQVIEVYRMGEPYRQFFKQVLKFMKTEGLC